MVTFQAADLAALVPSFWALLPRASKRASAQVQVVTQWLIIFVLGLLKLKSIKNDEGSTVMKLRLLENEENLFDTGLFVGLGGTVISLILLNVWQLKEASLVAAYASTLFGILFVAVLKIGFVRPYRNLLIREQEMIFEE